MKKNTNPDTLLLIELKEIFQEIKLLIANKNYDFISSICDKEIKAIEGAVKK